MDFEKTAIKTALEAHLAERPHLTGGAADPLREYVFHVQAITKRPSKAVKAMCSDLTAVADEIDQQVCSLKAENARLQERVGFMGLGTHAELVRVRYEMKKVLQENERLRTASVETLTKLVSACEESDKLVRLVRDLAPLAMLHATDRMREHYGRRMRELGIEETL